MGPLPIEKGALPAQPSEVTERCILPKGGNIVHALLSELLEQGEGRKTPIKDEAQVFLRQSFTEVLKGRYILERAIEDLDAHRHLRAARECQNEPDLIEVRMIGVVAALRESDVLRLGEDRGEVIEQKITGSGQPEERA